MGGYGSGRWGYGGKGDAKDLVEDCLTLDISRLVRDGVVRPLLSRVGGLSWSRRGQEVASIRYEVSATQDEGTFRFTYTVGRPGQERAQQDYIVPLITTRLVSDGRRWWFRCPAHRNGEPKCERRVGKLYLPPRGRVFACRNCHSLAYTSSRESRKWDGMFKSLAASPGLSAKFVKNAMEEDRKEAKKGNR
jgi:hypothetical protein